MPFFRSHLGFDCPARKGVADFLQEIALPSDQQVGRAWEQCILLVGPGWQKWQAHQQWRWFQAHSLQPAADVGLWSTLPVLQN